MSDQPGPGRPLPVVEEVLRVDRERVETGGLRVRVNTVASEQPLKLETLREAVDVERVPVGQAVTQRRAPWHDGDTLVVPVYEEQVVVERKLVLTEEVRLRPRRERHTEDTVAVLRRDSVVIERRNTDGSWSVIDNSAPRESSAEPTRSEKEAT